MRICLLIIFLCHGVYAQGQRLQTSVSDSIPKEEQYLLKPKALILPAGLIGLGVYARNHQPYRDWSRDLRDRLDPDGTKTMIDDVLPPLAMLTSFGLEVAGVKGKNSWLDKGILMGSSTLLMYSTVRIMKNNISERRPYGRSVSSFPSGHTALAFASAEVLHQEYGDQSIWYSIGGYSVGALTGFLRVYNDRHWYYDVLAGAGIGILSTKLVYWIYPKIKNRIFGKTNNHNKTTQLTLAPQYDGQQVQMGALLTF